MSLATITAANLPPQVYTHNTDHDVTLTANPAAWRPVRGIGTGWVKPHSQTGLWTSPVTARAADGAPTDSAWLEWSRAEMGADTADRLLTEVTPENPARLLLIDNQEHLAAIVRAYPAELNRYLGKTIPYPDWEALAADGWDGVYLTDRGQWATRLPSHGPDLYGWDMESLLWLRQAYSVGGTFPAAMAMAGGDAR
jgi:hypothetical protein